MARPLSIDQRRARLVNVLTPAGGVGSFDCPVCSAKGELHLTIYSDNPRPNYLFNLASFCGCDQQAVLDEISRRVAARGRS